MNDKNNKDHAKLFDGWTYTKKNYWIFGSGVAVIILGYLIMVSGEVYSFRSMTIAPIMLFFGYLVLIPLSLIYKDKK